jgi:hypothetical protein
MLKVWVGLEARSFLQASIETVSFPHSSYFRQALTPLSGRTMCQVRPTVTKHMI